MSDFRKAWRFLTIYGVGRTLFKILGRTRRSIPLPDRYENPDIGLIGGGQFGVATLGYFLIRRFGRRFRWIYDIDPVTAQSAAKVLGAENVAESAEKILTDPKTSHVYIASNHASHTDYAIAALEAGKTVYVEKPVSVSFAQFRGLDRAARRAPGRLFVGYNRPFSTAIRALRDVVDEVPKGGLSLNCFVSGHVLAPDHWYRDPTEGTRICGNAGHWIDLFVHLIASRDLPEIFRIQLLSADPAEADDNFMLSIATDHGDIFSLMLTARSEPFEGINETICFQQGEVIAKIHDFRRMTVWKGPRLRRWRFWPKDAGHKRAALQPFIRGEGRDWEEIRLSTLLMLHIAEMVRTGVCETRLSRAEALAELDDWTETA